MGSDKGNLDTMHPSDHNNQNYWQPLQLESPQQLIKPKKKKKKKKKKSLPSNQNPQVEKSLNQDVVLSQSLQRGVKKKAKKSGSRSNKYSEEQIIERIEQRRREEERKMKLKEMEQQLQLKEEELKQMEEAYAKEHEEMKDMAIVILKRIRKNDPRSLYIFDIDSCFRKAGLAILQNKLWFRNSQKILLMRSLECIRFLGLDNQLFIFDSLNTKPQGFTYFEGSEAFKKHQCITEYEKTFQYLINVDSPDRVGDLYKRCRLTPYPITDKKTQELYWPIDMSQHQLCGSQYQCQANTYCGNPLDYKIPLSSENITFNENIQYGFFHFDNVGVGILQVFRIITLEGWAGVMYNYQDSIGIASTIYFPALVVLGSFFLLNLFLAVIMETFSEMTEIQKKKDEFKQKLKQKRQKRAAQKLGIQIPGENHLENQGSKGHQAINRMLDVNQRKFDLLRGKLNTFGDAALLLLLKKRKERELEKLQIEPIDMLDNKILQQQVDEEIEFEESENFNPDQEKQKFNLKDEEQILEFDEIDKEVMKINDRVIDKQEMPDEYGEIQIGGLSIERKIENIEKIKEETTTWSQIESFMLKICDNKIFQWFISFTIIANTVCLALDKYPPDRELQQILDYFNILFFSIFLIEMIVKLVGLGPRLYVRDNYNIFDSIIVTLSIVDLIVSYAIPQDPNSSSEAGGGGAISAFRAFRLLRVFKLAKSWTKLQILLQTIMQSLKDISSFSILLFLLIFIYVLIGLELFANTVKFNSKGEVLSPEIISNLTLANQLGESPRNNFDDFYHAFLVIFQVIITDNWDTIMFQIARSQGYIAIAFFVSLIVIGVMFFLNIFLAILLENFGADNELMNTNAKNISLLNSEGDNSQSDFQQNKEVEKQENGVFSKLSNYLKGLMNDEESRQQKNKNEEISASKDALLIEDADYQFGPASNDQKFRQKYQKNEQDEYKNEVNIEKIFEIEEFNTKIDGVRNDKVRSALDQIQPLTPNKGDLKISVRKQSMDEEQNKIFQDSQVSPRPSNKNLSQISPKDKYDGKKSLVLILQEKKNLQKQADLEALYQSNQDMECQGYSLMCIGPDNCLRKFISKLTRHQIFEWFIILMIVISSVFLALDNPLNDPQGTLNKVLNYSDIGFTGLFGLECFLKIIAQGLIFNGKKSYLRNGWNVLDCIIVILSIVSVSIVSDQLKIVKIFRLIRVLRPLRLISRNKMLKIAIHALFMAVPSIINVIVVSILFFIIFGIIGINYFKGTFMYCQTDHLLNIDLTRIITKNDCLNFGGEWVNSDQNFDNMGEALSTLVQMASTEGWADVMNVGVDAVAVDKQPKKENGLYWSLFFIIFVVFGDFFIMNLFAGAVVMTFNQEKERLGKTYLLTDKQKRWLEQKRACLQMIPIGLIQQNENSFREKVGLFVQNRFFNYFIFLCVALNTLALGVSWYGEPKIVTLATSIMNYCFAGIFILEAILKLIGFGIKNYFKDPWNKFDFFVVILTIAAETASQAGGLKMGAAVTFIRVLRVQKVLRFIKRAKRIRIIFQTFLVTLPSLSSVGALLMLFLYVYSVLGVFLFAEVKLQTYLNSYANFQTFGNALLTLLRCSTGESWNSLMMDTMRSNSLLFQCEYSTFNYTSYVSSNFTTTGCGNNIAGLIFFLSFYLMVPLIFLNLFIAIILEGFETTNQAMSNLLQEDDLDNFIKCWSQFDTSGSGFIKISELTQLLFMLGEPLGWNQQRYEGNQILQDDFMEDLHISTYNNFQHVLFWDVIQALAKMYLIKLEMREHLKQQLNNLDEEFSRTGDEEEILDILEKQAGPNNEEQRKLKFQLRIELEFESIDAQLRSVMDVELIRLNEEALVRAYNLKKDQEYTSAHLKAGRKIMHALKKLVENRKINQNSEEMIQKPIQNLEEADWYQQEQANNQVNIPTYQIVGPSQSLDSVDQYLKEDTWTPAPQVEIKPQVKKYVHFKNLSPLSGDHKQLKQRQEW